MRCRQVRQKLSEYAAGELFPSEAAAVRRHLDRCERCRTEAEAVRRAEAALVRLADIEQAPQLTADLRAHIASGPAASRRRARIAAAAGLAVAAAAVAATGAAVLLTGPRKAAAPHAPTRSDSTIPPAAASRPQTPDVTPEVRAETSLPVQPPAIVGAPRPLPAEVMPEQAAIPAVVSVPVQGQPAGLDEGAVMEAAPAVASLMTQPERGGGVVLLLGQPEPVRPSPSYYLEVSLPNGARSVSERIAKLEPAGAPRVIHISYEHIAPGSEAQD